jgi:hypothetical protein
MSQRSSPRSQKAGGALSALEVDQHSALDDINYDEVLRTRPRMNPPTRNNRLPPRATLWILFMLVLGTILLTLGLGQHYEYWFGDNETDARIGLGMIGLGSFMFIPGSYGTYILYGAWNRWDGFSYDQLPNYGDE